MAIYETPGTNFHDLNLDWLISKMKELITEWAATEQDWEGVQAIINGWPATFDAYYRQPGHQLPETITNEAQRVANAAVEEEAGLREEEDDRLSDEIDEKIAQEVIDRDNAIDTAKTELQGDIATAISNNNTTVVNPIAQSVQTEQARAERVEEGLDSRLDAAEEAILGLEGAVRLDPTVDPDYVNQAFPLIHSTDASQRRNPGDQINLSEPIASSNFRGKIYDAAPYEIFSVSGYNNTTNVPMVTFLDANNVILAMVGNTYPQNPTFRNGWLVIAPPNTAKILVQLYVYQGSIGSKYIYRGMLSPYSRIMFGGSAVPSVTTNGRQFQYVREDYQTAQMTVYPFESFRWVSI